MLGMFLCRPHQFERRYLRGEIIPPGIAARCGSPTHKAAQLNHEQKLHTLEDLNLGRSPGRSPGPLRKNDHRRRGVYSPGPDAEKDALLAKGLDAAIRLTTLCRESLAPSIQIEVPLIQHIT